MENQNKSVIFVSALLTAREVINEVEARQEKQRQLKIKELVYA